MPPSLTHNQRIRLHQDQASFATCLSFLDLNDIGACLCVCQYWLTVLTKSPNKSIGWSGCSYALEEVSRQLRPLIPKIYHPLIRSLRISGEYVDNLEVDALEAFTSVQKISVAASRWTQHGRYSREVPRGCHTLFGLAKQTDAVSPTTTINHGAPITSFHLTWHRDRANPFPLDQLLKHPRFESLQELAIHRGSDAQPEATMLAIRELKELRKLTCFAPLTSKDDRWGRPAVPNLLLFEVIHQLPLLHTLNIGEIPKGIAPLPATITDLSLNEFPHDPSRLSALGSLKLKSFNFGVFNFVDGPHSSDLLKWLNQINTLKSVRISLGDATMRKGLKLVHSFVLHNSSQLLIHSFNYGLYEIELVREMNPPPTTDLSPDASCDKPSDPSSSDHPLRYFRDWRMKLHALEELYLVSMPLTPALIDCLSHLSNHIRLQRLELSDPYVAELNTPDPVDPQVVAGFCEFLGQQTQLHALVLQCRWIHESCTPLGVALSRCQRLVDVRIRTNLCVDCGGCGASLVQVLAQLPRLTQLFVNGSCFFHLSLLRVLVTSPSIRSLACSHHESAFPPVAQIVIAQFLQSYPHIQTRISVSSTRYYVETWPEIAATAAATIAASPDANEKKGKAPSKSRRCLIQ